MKAYTVILLSLVSLVISATENESYYSNLNIQSYEYFKNGQYLQAYKLAQQAKEHASSTDSRENLARALSNIASVSSVLGETDKALDIYLESLEISKSIDDIRGLESTLNNISGLYVSVGNFDEALHYIKLLPVLNNIQRPEYQRVVAYIALIGLYGTLEDGKKARYYIDLTSKTFENFKNDFTKFYFLSAKADLYRLEGKYLDALGIYKQAESIAIKNKFDGAVVSALKNQAKLLVELGKEKKAEELSKQAVEKAIKLGMKAQVIDLYQLQKKILVQQSKYEKAFKLFKKIIFLQKEIANEKIIQLVEITRAERQIEETESKLTQSKKDQKILELQLKQQGQTQLIWMFVLISAFIFLFLLHYRRSSKKEIARQKEVNKRLKELDRVKDRILKNTSHELRTPLNGIIGLSEVIVEQNKNVIEKSTLDMVRLIKSSGEQLAHVINDILEMSKSRSGEITIVNAQFDLVALIDDVINICSPLAVEKNISLNFQRTKNEELVFLDKSRLQQLLFNIIGNAVKFTEKGSVNVEYSIEEFGIIATVSDTGIGIPDNKIERILEGFEQVDSSDTRTNSGSGLGLAISRNICQALGGHLEISSIIKSGTKVTITLPFAG